MEKKLKILYISSFSLLVTYNFSSVVAKDNKKNLDKIVYPQKKPI